MSIIRHGLRTKYVHIYVLCIIRICDRYINVFYPGHVRGGYVYPCAFHIVKCGHWRTLNGHVLNALYAQTSASYAQIGV